MLLGLAPVCPNFQIRKSTKIVKPDVNVALPPDSSTYLFTCGIVIQILAVRMLNFYNRYLVCESLRLILVVRCE